MPTDNARDTHLAFGDFLIDRADERVLGPDGPLKLGQKAYRVLLQLVEHEGRLVTKDALFASVWDGTIVSESSLTSAIKELRRALGDESRTPRYIESVYGRGYRLLMPVRPADSLPRAAAAPTAAAAPGPRSVAEPPAEPFATEGRPPIVLVSAFRDEAIRERHPWCAAELREEVLSGLARFREIQLIADNRHEEEAAESRRHERGYQLTATLLPAGEGVRVIARARRLNDGLVLWAETMSLADTGTAAGVERIVRRIAGAALPAVDEDLLAGLPHDTDDLYERYLLAKRLSFSPRNFAEAKAAAEALERIIDERPGFALAYPPLVRLYNTDYGYTGLGASGDAERLRALSLAKAGLAADRGNVHAFTVLGFCHLWHGEFDRARTCFDQALALNPFNPVRIEECATAWMFMGDVVRARALMDQAFELNPTPNDDVHEDLARLCLTEGEYEAARAILSSMLGGSIWAQLYLAIAELRLGREQGRQRLRDWRARVEANWHAPPAPTTAELLGWIRRHNPFSPDLDARILDGVEEALGDGGSASRPRSVGGVSGRA